MLVANCLQKYKNNTRKGNFLLSFLTITSKKSKKFRFPAQLFDDVEFNKLYFTRC